MAQRKRVLLTGGAGMVGRNIAEHVGTHGWEMVTPTRAELDLERADAVRSFMREFRPQVVIHAAGLVGGIHANMARPVDFLVKNVDLGRNVILGAHASGVPQLINLGSSCMYPRDSHGAAARRAGAGRRTRAHQRRLCTGEDLRRRGCACT